MVQALTDELRALAGRVAAGYGLEIFDLQFRRESTGWVLRVIIDRIPANARASASAPRERSGAMERDASERVGGPGAEPQDEDVVGIEDCQHVSHDLSALLDVEEDRVGLPDVKYTLEVSSPGLDRPLRGEADYRRFEGRLAKIVTSEPVSGQSSFAGRLSGVEGGEILLAEGRRTHRVPLALVKRARLDVEF